MHVAEFQSRRNQADLTELGSLAHERVLSWKWITASEIAIFSERRSRSRKAVAGRSLGKRGRWT